MGEDRLAHLGDYPFARLAALLDGIAPGGEPVMMQVGEPQGAVPGFVAEAVAANAGLFGRYPPLPGSDDYRAAVADWLAGRYGLAAGAVDPARQVLATCGSREALFQIALMAAARKTARLADGVRPAVLLPNPLYHVYYGAAVMAGCEPVPVATTAETDFAPAYTDLPAKLLARTALCFLCTPGNPTGAVTPRDEMAALVETARRHDFVLAVDACYSEIWFDAPPPGGLEAAAALDGPDTDFANVLDVNSLSKRSGAPGLRCGFVAGDAGLVEALGRVRSYGGAQVPGPILAAGAALWRDEDHVAASRARYAELVETAEARLGRLPGYRRPEAAFFLWLDVRATAGDGETAARRLWAEAGVKALPGRYMARASEASGATPGDDHIRLALVHDPATVDDACRRIADVLGG